MRMTHPRIMGAWFSRSWTMFIALVLTGSVFHVRLPTSDRTNMRFRVFVTDPTPRSISVISRVSRSHSAYDRSTWSDRVVSC